MELLLEAEGLFRVGLRQLKHDPLAPIVGAKSLIKRTDELLAERLASILDAPNTGLRIKRDPQLINNFLAQGMDILLDAESLLQRWQQHPGERQELSALLDELTTLGEGAHLADLLPVDVLCEALLDLYGAVEESSLAVSERFFHEAQNAHEALINMLDELAAGQEVTPQPERIRALHDLLDESLDPSSMGLIRSDGSRTLSIRELGSATAELQQTASAFEADDEIVEIFLEEAVDILDSAGQALQRWLSDPDNAAPVPVDLVTASGSGLDPDISIAAAYYQAGRIARERRLGVDAVRKLIDERRQSAFLGFLGEPRVNVLALNLALDQRR